MIAVCDFVEIKTFVVKRHENGLCEVLDDRMDVMIKPDDILYITRRPDKSKLYLITLKNSNACFAVTKRQLNKLLGVRKRRLDNPRHVDFEPKIMLF